MGAGSPKNKEMVEKLKKIFTQRGYLANCLINIFPFLFSDKFCIKTRWKFSMGDLKLDLKNPRTYNEKLQWLKLYDHNPEYHRMVDKVEAKKWVAEKMGTDDIIIPTIAVYDRVEDIDWEALPQQFVIKCNHNSNCAVIVKDKSLLNIEKAMNKLRQGLQENYFYAAREWPYKGVKPRILVEQYLEEKKSSELKDYKFFCFNGECKVMYIVTGRQNAGQTYSDYFDMNFTHLPIRQDHPNSPASVLMPENFDRMKEIAARLSKGIPQVRVDLYEVSRKVYFGEMTFFPNGGFMPFEPSEWNSTFGDWISLPQNN